MCAIGVPNGPIECKAAQKTGANGQLCQVIACVVIKLYSQTEQDCFFFLPQGLEPSVSRPDEPTKAAAGRRHLKRATVEKGGVGLSGVEGGTIGPE